MCIAFTLLKLHEKKGNSIPLGQGVERGTLQLLSHLRKHWLEEKTAYGTHTALPRTRAVHGPPDEQWVLLPGSQHQHS